MSISMVDVAYQVLNGHRRAMNFAELWRNVCKRMNLNSKLEGEKMSQFFTNLTLDNRFALVNNRWDIRARHKLEEVLIDTSELVIEEDEDEEFVGEEEKEYEESNEEEEE